jgi:hypothetical protein
MTGVSSTVNKHLGDLIAVERHCLDAIERQCNAPFVREDAGIAELLQRTRAVLASQVRGLEERLALLDGSARWKEAVTSVTGFLAGLYDKLRSEPLSRALRDDFAALHFVYVCQTMFITTAEACGDSQTAQQVRDYQQEIPPLLLRVGDCIPAAVIEDLEKEGVAIVNRDAADQAVQTAHESWRGASVHA